MSLSVGGKTKSPVIRRYALSTMYAVNRRVPAVVRQQFKAR